MEPPPDPVRIALSWRSIGIIHSPFATAAGTPIQPVYAHGAAGQVVLDASYAAALDDIEGFERVWLVYWMDRVSGFRSRVTPYRDTHEHGLFATRSPCRPNPIGLSVVRLLGREGRVLRVADLDILDGTPLLDLKPYVPEFDAHPRSRAGWFEGTTEDRRVADGRFHGGACDVVGRSPAGGPGAGGGARMTGPPIEVPSPPADSPAAQAVLDATGTSAHAGCLFCGKQNPIGFKLEFHARDDGSVHARFPCGHVLQSYHETLHGGVVAALLDSAMTNCLFARGVVAVTAELTVRFLSPVRLEHPAEVSAAVTRVHGALHQVRAELVQDGTVAARASAKFLSRERRSPPGIVAAPLDRAEGSVSGSPPSPHPEPRPTWRPR